MSEFIFQNMQVGILFTCKSTWKKIDIENDNEDKVNKFLKQNNQRHHQHPDILVGNSKMMTSLSIYKLSPETNRFISRWGIYKTIYCILDQSEKIIGDINVNKYKIDKEDTVALTIYREEKDLEKKNTRKVEISEYILVVHDNQGYLLCFMTFSNNNISRKKSIDKHIHQVLKSFKFLCK